MPIGNPVTLTSNVASKTISVTATASQTLFNVTGGYRINELGVFKNGLRLQDGVDYTARDGLTVTLLSAASGGDKLQFVVFDTFRVAEAIRPNVDEQTIRGNLNVVGILSATSLGGLTNFNLTSGITTFNDVRVGGALTVAGALTFEDVTNIDSVGIITAQSHVSIADSILHTGDTDTSIRFPSVDTFTVETAGSERLRINSSGQVGIGTNAPSALLHVEKDGTSEVLAKFESNLGTNNNRAITISSPTSDSGSEPFIFNTGNSYEFQTDNEVALHIDSSGDVGIGTDNPGGTLHVHGAVGGAGQIYLTDGDAAGTGNSFLISKGGTTTTLKDRQASSNLDFGTADTIAMRIDSSQRVIIADTDADNANANADDLIIGNTSQRSGLTIVSGNTNDGNIFFSDGTAAGNANVQGQIVYHHNDHELKFYVAAGKKLTIDQGGGVNISGITTATQLFEGTTRVATTGKAIAMAMLFG